MKRVFWVFIFVLASTFCASAALSTPVYPTNCFFSVQNDTNGVWWIVDPNGKTFWSKGIDVMNPNGDTDKVTGVALYKNTVQSKYANFSVWADAQVQRTLKWQVNTFGAWTHNSLFNKQMPYTTVLDFYRTWATASGNTYPDFYDPGFATTVNQIIRKSVLPRVNDPYFLGWVLDNEVHLGPNWWSSVPLLSYYLNYSTSAPGYKAALSFAQSLYSNIADINKNWKINISSWDELHLITLQTSNAKYISDSAIFGNATAVKYFNTTCSAIRNVDPNHLILGMKYNGYPNPYVTWADATYGSDVLTIDYYRAPAASYGEITSFHKDSLGKPIIFGEFAYCANDTGLPNTKRSCILVDTQEIRAQYYSNWMRNVSKMSFVVGAWMFQYIDQPAGGRGDGENGNLGIVNGTDFEYEALGAAMTEVHPTLESLHGDTAAMPAQCTPRIICPNQCSGHGVCDTSSGRCICDSYYAGGDCSIPAGYLSQIYTSTTDLSDWTTDDNWWWNYYTYIRSSYAYTPTSNGIALYLNGTGCPSLCKNSQYSGGGFLTQYSYSYGWVNVTIKGPPEKNSMFGIRWIYTDAEFGRDGHQVEVNQTGVSAYTVYKGTYTRVYTSVLTFNQSSDYHTYSIFWSHDNSMKFAIDGTQVGNGTSQHLTTSAQIGIYVAATGTVPVNLTAAYIKSVVYETEVGWVKATLPTSSPPPSSTSSTSSPTDAPSSSSSTLSPGGSTTSGQNENSSASVRASLFIFFLFVCILLF